MFDLYFEISPYVKNLVKFDQVNGLHIYLATYVFICDILFYVSFWWVALFYLNDPVYIYDMFTYVAGGNESACLTHCRVSTTD